MRSKGQLNNKKGKTEVRKFNVKIITNVNANLIIDKSYTFTYDQYISVKTRFVGKFADFAIISITNPFLDDILSKYTNNIIHQSIVKLACTDSMINT